MQTFITCGTPWCDLQAAQAILQSAGVAPARSTTVGSVSTVAVWHDRLFADQLTCNAAIHPGKPWELAAGEIFLANWDQQTWGWADSRSTWLLEYWRDFDPNTRFVLLHTPAYDVLCRAMVDPHATDFDAHELLNTWCAYQTEFLRFYHRNRSRCVFVHAHLARQSSTLLVQAVSQTLGTTFGTATGLLSVNRTIDPLLHLLVQGVLQANPQMRALEDEINATLPDGDTIQPMPLVNIASACARLRVLYGKEADQSTQRAAQQLNDVKQELTLENELLILQLHQVQEELEHYVLQYQRAIQEKQAAEAQLKKLLAHYPDHAEWESVELLSGTVPLRCQVHGLQVCGQKPRDINISVEVVDRIPILVVTPPEQVVDQPLCYWPILAQVDGSVVLATLHLNPSAPTDTEAAALLRSLAPSDLQLVRAACMAMVQDLPDSLPARDAWVEVIGTLRQRLAYLPPAWRFDSVQLKRHQVNPGYEHLWFELGNAFFGERHWPTFEFRLSAADIKQGEFSHLPKLEFPKSSDADKQFENWFDEPQERGDPRFELRFDIQNNAMDIGLWKALSNIDQAQALSICEQLPVLLQRLKTQNVHISRPWSDWQGLVAGLQQAISHCLGVKF